ncbi:unnamed protein product [Diatraea saccharalis]|uniref:Protein phosphatase 1 regulatory subunit 35 C-terminal domain-containing protein n=1 Tax=Diatraea saccharalis TaxID=40085 RepID=A0A9N9R380_9NEOP|nr:unnamed protein product [Diatraea saccharalis]
MNKHGSSNKVKKTLVRNFEQKKVSGHKQLAKLDMGCSSNLSPAQSSSKRQTGLSQPSLCSSEAFAHYISDIKRTTPSPNIDEELKLDKCQLEAKVTKKLNFHFNDRIYKNLIELNARVDETKIKKDKRPSSANIKRDLEPNIEDFCYDEKEYDMVPTVPIIQVKFKPVKKVDDGQLHKLVASFEDL